MMLATGTNCRVEMSLAMLTWILPSNILSRAFANMSTWCLNAHNIRTMDSSSSWLQTWLIPTHTSSKSLLSVEQTGENSASHDDYWTGWASRLIKARRPVASPKAPGKIQSKVCQFMHSGLSTSKHTVQFPWAPPPPFFNQRELYPFKAVEITLY